MPFRVHPLINDVTLWKISSSCEAMSAAAELKLRDYRRIKLVTAGSSAVGKSCLIKRYCESKFVSRYISTIGVDFGVRGVAVDGKKAKVHFWDLSGNPSFAEIRNEFYGNAQGLMLVFDVTNRSSFDDLGKWLREAKTYGLDAELGGECKCMVLCGNKSDLTSGGKKRAVSESDAREFARSKNMLYFETSAKTGKNVSEVFSEVFQSIVRALDKQTHENTSS